METFKKESLKQKNRYECKHYLNTISEVKVVLKQTVPQMCLLKTQLGF